MNFKKDKVRQGSKVPISYNFCYFQIFAVGKNLHKSAEFEQHDLMDFTENQF